MGQKYKRFREIRTPFSLRDIRMYARVPQAMAQFVLKIEKLCHIMGPTPILEMARAYGLRPRLWLLILHFSCFSAVFRVFLGVFLFFLRCSGFSWGCSWFSWGVSGFLGVFRVFLGVFLVFLECSGFSWGVPGFLGSVPGFLGVFRVFGCSGMFRDVPVFRCSVFRCS